MSEREARPAALRVQVADVATRTSLVSITPPIAKAGSDAPAPISSETPVVLAVLQRPVRVISDPPPPASAASSDPPAVSAPPARLSLPEKFSVPSPYASIEVEPLETLELGEDGGYSEGDEPDEGDDEPHVIEMSTPPPPAPAHALKRPAPSNDVSTLNGQSFQPDFSTAPELEPDSEEDEVSRPSGEFEELEMESDAPPGSLGSQRSAPPPPPPPPIGRLSMPEPPDLKTLTRSARVQELRPSKPRPHPWWEVFFDDDYLRTVRPPTPEQIARQTDFVERSLGLKPGATVLDVGCGLGLNVIELTARGYLAVGLDLSLAMLSRASEESQARGTKINFLHADMREMNFEGAFDAITCLGTTFGYFDDEANRKVIDRFHRALKPGGVLLLDVVNRDHVIRSQPNLIWFEGEGCVCMEESEFNFFTSRLHVKRTVILDTGKQLEHEYSLRLFSLHELGQMLHTAGFRVAEVSGREALPGVFFGQESPNLLVIAERRAENTPRIEGTGKFKVVPA